MKVAIAQIAPAYMDRAATIDRIAAAVREAGAAGAGLVCFGETLAPGYPVWLSRTDWARFDDPVQKELHALYVDQGVEEGHLKPVCEAAAAGKIAVVVGVAERGADRGGHTVYASRVFISGEGRIESVHRKLMPTYEERLCWGIGDGAGLRVHRVGEFTVGALNCWENWMPLARVALHAQGETLHVMLWPGRDWNTREITRFAAMEGRSFVVSASALLREKDIPAWMPQRERIVKPGESLHNGGSCIAGPDGTWIVEPVVDREGLIYAEVDAAAVRRERQNFDPSGHYARPDVFSLRVDRRRQGLLDLG